MTAVRGSMKEKKKEKKKRKKSCLFYLVICKSDEMRVDPADSLKFKKKQTKKTRQTQPSG